ncbi:MAG: T9SS type A sorting domain-containing protein [Bacteroidetes bacterium]|nr:T9SS type A sorting domain-containing protein [Bacteroidota bacterium]
MKIFITALLLTLKLNFLFAGIDVGIIGITTPSGNICNVNAFNFQPVAVLKNFGPDTLVSCEINFSIDYNSWQTYNWNGSLLPNQTINVTLTYMNASSGNHLFTCYSNNPNGENDLNAGNDNNVSNFFSPYDLQMSENFDGAIFPPIGWQIINYDNDITWDTIYTDTVSKNSLYMDNFHYNNSSKGQVDEIISPPVVLGSFPYCMFNFSNKKFTDPALNPVYEDTLELFISIDCGSTWSSIWKKYGSQLVTASPPFDTTEFIPKSYDWSNDLIGFPLNQWQGKSSLFKFRHTTDCENNLYIDNFEITFWFGINESRLNSSVQLYPNPFNTTAEVNILNQNLSNKYFIKLFDILGQEVFKETVYSSKFILQRNNLYSGIYFFQVSDDNYILLGNKKVIIE